MNTVLIIPSSICYMVVPSRVADSPLLPPLGTASPQCYPPSERLAAELTAQLRKKSSRAQGPERRMGQGRLQEAASGDATGSFDPAGPLGARAALRGTAGEWTPGHSDSKGPLGARAALRGTAGEEWQRHGTRVSRDTLGREGPTEGQRAAEAPRAEATAQGPRAKHQCARQCAAHSATLPPAPPGVGRGGSGPPGRQQRDREVQAPGQAAAPTECSAAGSTAPTPRTPALTAPSSPGADHKASTHVVRSSKPPLRREARLTRPPLCHSAVSGAPRFATTTAQAAVQPCTTHRQETEEAAQEPGTLTRVMSPSTGSKESDMTDDEVETDAHRSREAARGRVPSSCCRPGSAWEVPGGTRAVFLVLPRGGGP